MVQISLVEYVKKQIAVGRNLEDVKKYLKQQGYDPSEVDSSAQYAFNLKNNPQHAQNQRIEQLAVYVEQQIHAGYQIPQVKQYLVNSGYPYMEVDAAINLIQKPAKKEHTMLIAALVIVFVMGVGIIAITTMNIKLFSEQQDMMIKQELLDVKAKKLTTAPVPGESLDFQLDIFSLGTVKRYDIELDYKIVNRDTSTVVAGQTETFAIETSTSKVFGIDIPSESVPGKYLLEIEARYDNITAKAGFIFDLYPSEQVQQITPVVPEKNASVVVLPEELQQIIKNITEEEKKPLPVKPLPVVVPQPTGQTKQEVIELAKRTALIDPTKAASQCLGLKFESQQTDCIMELGKFKKDPALCGYINISVEKEACYMQIFIENPEKIDCSLLTDENIKKSCELLAQSSALISQAEEAQRAQLIVPSSTP